MKNNSAWYVYTLARNGIVFYVGKGTGNRVNQHELVALRIQDISIKSSKIIQAYLQDDTIEKQIIAMFIAEQHALVFEGMLIEAYGIENLTNKNRGYKDRKLEVTGIVVNSNRIDKLSFSGTLTLYDAFNLTDMNIKTWARITGENETTLQLINTGKIAITHNLAKFLLTCINKELSYGNKIELRDIKIKKSSYGYNGKR